MNEVSYDEVILKRLLEQPKTRLWEGGPSFAELLDHLCQTCVDAAQLDTWLPMSNSNSKSYPLIAFFFQGAALRLADKLLVHRRIATSALLFAAINHIFPQANLDATTKLILELGEPELEGQNRIFVIHMFGARAVDEWFKSGVHTTAPSSQFLFVINLINENAVESIKNPNGLADIIKQVVLPRK